MFKQYGSGVCSLCNSPGTNKLTCPMNSESKNPNPIKHPLATARAVSPPARAAQRAVLLPARAAQRAPSPPARAAQRAPSPPARAAQRAPSPPARAPSPPAVKTTQEKPKKLILKTQPRLKVIVSPPPRASAATESFPASDISLLTTRSRMALKADFEKIILNKDARQCVSGQLDKYFSINKRIGNGTFGVVYSASTKTHQFAVKEARTTGSSYKQPWSEKTDWKEALILRDIAQPIIENGICPNVPLVYSAYACNTCEFEGLTAQKKKYIKPCIILLMELASGDLSNWLNTKPSEVELYNALFQVLAGLYALEKHGQVFNNDIKAPNILYYNVKPGGYWIYNIMGKRYHVPNFGRLFVINDFGVSDSFSPELQYSYNSKYKNYSLGSRFYTVLNDKIVPFGTTNQCLSEITLRDKKNTRVVRNVQTDCNKKIIGQFKATLSPAQLDLLRSNGIPEDPNNLKFYSNIDIIPPTHFAEDVFDAISMFTGGMRSTQEGTHADPDIPASVKAVLSPYISSNVKLWWSNPDMIPPPLANAGYFINELFGKRRVENYLDAPSGSPIEVYNI